MSKQLYFTLPSGENAYIYTLCNRAGGTVKISDWGGTLVSLEVPDRNGTLADVLLGWKNPSDYLKNPGHLGALVGRVANRIAGGRFVLDGIVYQMVLNDTPRPNTLHGGAGYSRRLWQTVDYDDEHLTLRMDSPDGDAGFPGHLKLDVTYAWNNNFELSITYHAVSNAVTVANFTNHAYFNLNGEASNDTSDLTLRVNADFCNPVDENLIPSGIQPVGMEIPDLRRPMKFSDVVKFLPNGLDHNYILGRDFSWKADCVEVVSARTGIAMTVSTDRTGVQVYMGGFLNGSGIGKGAAYGKFGGFCLETQEWPDAPNHADFPSIRLEPGKTYDAKTTYAFSTKK